MIYTIQMTFGYVREIKRLCNYAHIKTLLVIIIDQHSDQASKWFSIFPSPLVNNRFSLPVITPVVNQG